MDREQKEFKDVCNIFWIKDVKNIELWTWDINIFLWWMRQEPHTLAKAVFDCKKNFWYKINVILANIDNSWTYIFDWKWFKTCITPYPFGYTFIKKHVTARMCWDMPKFEKYSEDKHLS